MKNLINYLSKKSLSLGNGPALDRRWTGHESGRFLSILTLFLMLFSFGVGNVWGAAGDEVTSVSNITSGKWYYIKGVRTAGTVEYLTFPDATAASASGTSASSTAGATPLKFTYESSSWYITTPNGYYITPAASNGCITVTSTKTSVTLGEANSLITILGASYYLQKNKSAANFGGYNNTQNNVSLIEATTYTVSWQVNEGACSGSPTTLVVAGLNITALPTTPTSENCDNRKVFMGWSATEIDGSTNTEPSDLFTAADEAPAITGNVTYYAVFASRSGSGTAKWKVTTTIKTGKTYVMGAVKAAAASDLANNTTIGAITFATAYSSTDWGTYSDITPNSDGEIADASVTDAMKWRLKTISSGNHAFKKGANYLYLKGSGTGSNTCGVNSTANVYLEGVSATCKDAFLLHPTSTSSGANKLLLNTGKNYGYRMYGSSQTASASMCPYIRFYVYDDGYTYSNYVTTCCDALGAVNGAVSLSTKTAYTITATWPTTEDGNETGYSVQLYDNNGSGAKGSAHGLPVSIIGTAVGDRTCTFGAKTPVGSRLTPNTLYFVGVTPTYDGDGDYCEEGTEVTASTTTNQVYTVVYAAGTGGSGSMTDSNSPYEEGDEVTVLANDGFSKCGSHFDSWSYSPAQSVTDGKFTMGTANVTLTATWAANDNDVYHDWMSSIETSTNKSGSYSMPAAISDKVEAVGCEGQHKHFIGWVAGDDINEDGSLKSGATIYEAGHSGMCAEGKHYYAVWADEE